MDQPKMFQVLGLRVSGWSQPPQESWWLPTMLEAGSWVLGISWGGGFTEGDDLGGQLEGGRGVD